MFGLLLFLGSPLERTDKGATGRRAVDVQFLPELASHTCSVKMEAWKKPRTGAGMDPEPERLIHWVVSAQTLFSYLLEEDN